VGVYILLLLHLQNVRNNTKPKLNSRKEKAREKEQVEDIEVLIFREFFEWI
jgi:hypothetical protein